MAKSCPVCHSPDFRLLDCDEPPDEDSSRSHAICCRYVAVRDMRSGPASPSDRECATTFSRRELLADEERISFAAAAFARLFDRLGTELNRPGTIEAPLRFTEPIIDLAETGSIRARA